MLKDTRITKSIILRKKAVNEIYLSLQDSVTLDIRLKIYKKIKYLIEWKINRCRISILNHLY